MSAISGETAAVVTWAGQIFLILSGALVLIGALTVIGYFHTAKIDKKLKAHQEAIELIIGDKKANDERLDRLERVLNLVKQGLEAEAPPEPVKKTPPTHVKTATSPTTGEIILSRLAQLEGLIIERTKPQVDELPEPDPDLEEDSDDEDLELEAPPEPEPVKVAPTKPTRTAKKGGGQK